MLTSFLNQFLLKRFSNLNSKHLQAINCLINLQKRNPWFRPNAYSAHDRIWLLWQITPTLSSTGHKPIS